MATRAQYIDLEVQAWAFSKAGINMAGVTGVRKRAKNVWNHLPIAQKDPLRLAVDALHTALDNVNALDVALNRPNVTDDNAVAAYTTATLARGTVRLALVQAFNNYLLLRAPYPRADLVEFWFEVLQVDQELIRVAEEDELARIQNQNNQDRLSGGRLTGQWVDIGAAGDGGNQRYLRTFVKTVGGLIVDRVVIKDETRMFDFNSVWDSITVPGRDLPTEITTMLRLRTRIGSENIVKLRNWRVEAVTGAPPRPERFRVYLEACGLGDLSDFNGVLPEPFLWKMFDDLVKACIILDRGDVDPGGATWEPIVHRDLKLENVFLSNPGTAFCRYPTAKLGDFGAAIFIPANDVRTFAQLNHRDIGTPHRRPPEQLNDFLTGSPTPHRMSTSSNVWCIGSLMWCLVQEVFSNDRAELPDASGFDPANLKPYDFNAQAQLNFTADLRDLIMDCVEYLPPNRPSLYDVQRRVKLGIRMHCQALQNAAQNDPAWNTMMPNLAAEKWALTGPPDDDSDEDLGGPAGGDMIFLPSP